MTRFDLVSLNLVCCWYSTAYAIKSQCFESIQALVGNNLEIANSASSDVDSRVLTVPGFSVDIGAYDLCYQNNTVLQHCLVGSIAGSMYAPLSPISGICIPAECTVDDLNNRTILISIIKQFSNASLYTTSIDISKISYENKIYNSLLIANHTNTGFTCGKHQAFVTTDRYIILVIFWIVVVIVDAFSLVKNIGYIFKLNSTSSGSQDDFRIFDGMRCISILWIVLGHTLAISASIGLLNPAEVLPPKGIIKDWSSQIFLSSRFGVDTFFYISGFLVVHSILEKFKSTFGVSKLHSNSQIFPFSSDPLTSTPSAPSVHSYGTLNHSSVNEDKLSDVIASEYSLEGSDAVEHAEIDSLILKDLDNTTIHDECLSPLSRISTLVQPLQRQSPATKCGAWIPFMYLMRYLRIVPTYLVCLLFWWKIAVLMGQGPFWFRWLTFTHRCDQFWWTNLLFVNNLVPYLNSESNECFYVSWYLSVDFQFYVLAPLFVMAYLKHPILGFVAALAACLLSTFLLAYKTAQHGYSAMSFDGLWVTGYSFAMYTKPQMRIQPYCIGMLTAMLWNYKASRPALADLKLPQMLAHGLLSLAALTIAGYTFGASSAYQRRPCLYNEPSSNHCGSNWSLNTRVVYNSTSKICWSLALSAVTLLCANRQAEPIRRFLSHSLFFIASKLTYAVYLIHVILLNIWVYSRTQKYRYSHFEFAMVYLGVVCVSFIVGLFVTVLVESPAAALTRMLEARLKTLAL